MKRSGALLLAGWIAVWAVAAPARAERAPEPGRLSIEVSGLKGKRGKKGRLAYALFDSPLRYDSRSDPVRSGFVDVGKKKQQLVVDLPPGTYAAMFYQDRNGNGELDRNFLGIPSEPYGFSNNARASFGPPSFDEARFEFRAGMDALRVRLR